VENTDLHLLLEIRSSGGSAQPACHFPILLIRLSLIFDIKRGRAFRHFLLAPMTVVFARATGELGHTLCDRGV
jgi:hypothetical protein